MDWWDYFPDTDSEASDYETDDYTTEGVFGLLVENAWTLSFPNSNTVYNFPITKDGVKKYV